MVGACALRTLEGHTGSDLETSLTVRHYLICIKNPLKGLCHLSIPGQLTDSFKITEEYDKHCRKFNKIKIKLTFTLKYLTIGTVRKDFASRSSPTPFGRKLNYFFSSRPSPEFAKRISVQWAAEWCLRET